MRTVMLTFVAVLLTGASSPAQVGVNSSEQVERVIERTKNTTATYSVYNWNWIAVPGHPVIEEWSAEFNSGDLHRVETPRDRLIANCRTKTGSALSLTTGQITRGPAVAGVACGISTNAKFLSMEYIGHASGPFGDTDSVRVTDNELVRNYEISDTGVIVKTIFALKSVPSLVVLDDEAVALEHQLPSSEIFSVESLQESVVPSQFKTHLKSSK